MLFPDNKLRQLLPWRVKPFFKHPVLTTNQRARNDLTQMHRINMQAGLALREGTYKIKDVIDKQS